MKRFLCVAVACLTVVLSGARFLITQYQALVSEALTTLKLESVPGPPGIVGAPPKFKVTKATVAHLEKLLKDGKVVEVEGNGSLKVVVMKQAP